MTKFTISASTTFGLEAVVGRELRELGYEELKTENGRVSFIGEERDIAICNLHLRAADRVFIDLASFEAVTFDELFDQVYDLPWEDILPQDARIHVNGKSVKSTLFSISDCQALTKKAIINKLKTRYKQDYFPEDGPLFKIEVALLKDIATISIDTSGAGLHKRGYRSDAGEAPLKETMAAALVYLSRWRSSSTLLDPFCGSATILIEAAMIANKIPPGIKRSFISEEWPWFDPQIWEEERAKAKSLIENNDFRLLGSDIDKRVLQKAQENIRNAGLENQIKVQKLSIEEVQSSKKYGCIITNPPYGLRLGEQRNINKLYSDMGKVFKELDTWSFFVLTANEEIEEIIRMRANKKRKLYNGNIKCNLYQFFGPFPPRSPRDLNI